MGSSTNVNTAGISANTTNTTTTAIVSSPPSSYGRASPALGTRPVPGRTGVTRERVNSTGSEGVMTAGLFRQAARRSNTNLVEEAGPASPRSSVTGIRDREKRGPPTRSWDVRDKDGDQSSGSERVSAPVRGGGATSDRSALGVGGKPRTLGRSSSAMPSVGGESSPESPSPFAAALSKLGEEDPLTRSGYEGGGARLDYARYGVRSEGAVRSVSAAAVPVSRPTQPRPSIHGINVRPEMRGVNARPMPQSASASPQSAISRPSPPGPQSSIPRPGPQGINSSRPGPQSATSQRPGPQSANSVPAPQRPGPQSAHSRPSLPNARSSSPTKPRQSAPTAMGRSPPIRTTIPTKTNDGPSIKPRATSPVRMMSSRPPSPARSTRSNRSVPGSPTRSIASSPTKSIMSKSTMASSPTKSAPGLPIKSSMRRPSVDTTGPSGGHSRYASVDTYRAKSPSADMYRAKSPSVDMTRAKSPAPSHMSRAKSPAPSNLSRSGAKSPGPGSGPAPRTGYVPPPRQSSLARPMDLVDSDEDESEDPEVESEEELGYGSRPGEKKVTESDVGVLRGRGSGSSSSPFASRQGSSTGHDGLTRERTITQRTAGSGRGSPSRDDDRPPKPPPKVGVSLFDRPVPPSSVSSLSSSPFDKFGTPPSSGTPPSRGRASHSTSAISAAATARNSAAIAEANRRLGVHSRGASSTSTTPGRSSHIRSPAEATDTDEDEDDKSETDSEDNAPLSSIVPPRRPGSAASNAPPMVRSFGRAQKPLVDLSSGPNGPPPPRPPRRVPGVGVTRNSSLRGSRSVEDLGRMTMAPGSAIVGATGRPGPRPFATSPPSSTGDSNSSKAPVTPRDGSEAGGRRVVGASSLGPAGDEARRKERRRSEAKASVELGNVINGPGVMDDDDEDGEHMSAQMHGGMGMMGWGQQGLYPQMTGYQGFPVSQSMPSFPGQFPTSQSMPFIPPPPPPGASEQYVAAHQQAMMMAKQAYLSAVAQQAMMFATEQWERSSNAGGSVYGGSQMGGGGGGMMGMPMMGMYANSAYASSMYEGSVIGGGGGGGWGSASAYGGGARSVYGGGGAGAKSEYGGGMKSSPTKSNAGGPGRSRLRAQTATAEVPPLANRGNPVPPSTWTTRRKASPPGRYQ
ncbi:hypothetical protein FRC12_016295 [Ceratobasidium sp. 428]|nr:hypothetical protein FRC12_016295 [Ceratobasidium sp. 428]